MNETINKKLIAVVGGLGFFTLIGCSSAPPKPEPTKAAGYNAKLGAEYLSKGRLNLANEKLRRALEQDPNSVDAHHYYALLQQSLKLDENADKHFKKALSLKKSPELHNNYGSFLCKRKDYDGANKQFAYALKDPLYRTPEYAYANAGSCAMDAGDFGMAKSYLETALSKNRHLPSALLDMAHIYNKKGDYSRAQAYLFRYNEVAGHSKRSLKLCKQVHIHLNEMKKVSECDSILLNKFPNSKAAVGQ